MIKSRFGTIRNFDAEFDPPITNEALHEVDAKICLVEVDGERFIEIKTLGSVDAMYDPEELQVLRFSKSAIDLIVGHWKFYHKDA